MTELESKEDNLNTMVDVKAQLDSEKESFVIYHLVMSASKIAYDIRSYVCFYADVNMIKQTILIKKIEKFFVSLRIFRLCSSESFTELMI